MNRLPMPGREADPNIWTPVPTMLEEPLVNRWIEVPMRRDRPAMRNQRATALQRIASRTPLQT